MTTYSLSVIELALPSPNEGSIDTYSGFSGTTSLLAMKAHQQVQSGILLENPAYAAEVEIKHRLAYKGYQFFINGRADGIYQEQPIRIEEIKTALEPAKLVKSLGQNYFTHPYWLQLQVYGYLHWLNTQNKPDLNLLLVSLRNKTKTQILPLVFDIDAFESWLNRRLDELILEIKDTNKRMIRRKKLGLQCAFPFTTPRYEQKKLMDAITSNMSANKRMLMQAPTGLGKTLGVLFPTLKESLRRGQKKLYLTPKNSQHEVALNSIRLLQSQGSDCKTLILTSKKKLCMKPEPLCLRQYCEFAKNHYSKCTEHHLKEKIQA